MPVRLAIANDYEIVVRGVAAMLEPFEDRVSIVDLAVDEGLSAAADVTLFDVFGSGEVHTGDITRVTSDPRSGAVAVYTANFDPALVRTAERLGLRGYLSKGLSAERLVDAVERLANGELVTEQAATTPTSRTETDRRWPGKLYDLTEREAEVLALITQGYDNESIAGRLYISPNTVKTRIRTLYRKMGFDNRVQAALWGQKHGFETDTGASASTRS